MNRESLFKGKRKDNGEWVEGNILKLKCDNSDDEYVYYIIPEVTNGSWYKSNYALKFISPCFEVKPETICQYTGLTDKNSKKIWEDDITKLVLSNGEVRYFKVSFKKVIRKVLCHPDFDDDVAKVELNAVCFEWNGYELFPCIDGNGVSDVSKMEVVGNIFDNPESLNQ